jgi:hypothetical protein
MIDFIQKLAREQLGFYNISQKTNGIVTIEITVLRTRMEAASSGPCPYFAVSTKLITAPLARERQREQSSGFHQAR